MMALQLRPKEWDVNGRQRPCLVSQMGGRRDIGRTGFVWKQGRWRSFRPEHRNIQLSICKYRDTEHLFLFLPFQPHLPLFSVLTTHFVAHEQKTIYGSQHTSCCFLPPHFCIGCLFYLGYPWFFKMLWSHPETFSLASLSRGGHSFLQVNTNITVIYTLLL